MSNFTTIDHWIYALEQQHPGKNIPEIDLSKDQSSSNSPSEPNFTKEIIHIKENLSLEWQVSSLKSLELLAFSCKLDAHVNI